MINEIPKRELLKIHNAVSAIFYMENTDSADYDRAIDDLIDIIKEPSILEAKVFANWVNNYLLNLGKELTEDDLQKINSPDEVLPMMAANMERYKEELTKKAKHNREIEIALNLLKAGSEINFVAKLTGLTIEEVKKLQY